MSGKKMQTHDHTIRVWLRCAAACVPLSAVGRGRQGRGMFGEKAETEWFLSLQWKEGLAKGGGVIYFTSVGSGRVQRKHEGSFGGKCVCDRAGCTFPIYSWKWPIKICLKYLKQTKHQALYPSRNDGEYDVLKIRCEVNCLLTGLMMLEFCNLIFWLSELINDYHR